jgi:CheY-like chemotaxis protein
MARKVIRVLVVEDDDRRVQVFQRWLDGEVNQRRDNGELCYPCEVRLVWAKSAGAAIGLLERDPGSVYAGIMLDHDLDRHVSWGVPYTGQDVVKKIVEVVSRDTMILVHSMNKDGGPRMRSQLEEAGFCVERIPFFSIRLSEFRNWMMSVCDQVAG